MAHHKSAKKRIKTSAKKQEANKNVISRIRTLVKKVFNSTDKAEAEKLYRETVAIIDKNVCKGRIHKNTAARKKSALTKYFNELTTTEAAK